MNEAKTRAEHIDPAVLSPVLHRSAPQMERRLLQSFTDQSGTEVREGVHPWYHQAKATKCGEKGGRES